VLAAGGGEGGRECFFHAKIGCGAGVLAAVKGSQSMRARGLGGEVLHTSTYTHIQHTSTYTHIQSMRARGLGGEVLQPVYEALSYYIH
jgi:hypothetical protein